MARAALAAAALAAAALAALLAVACGGADGPESTPAAPDPATATATPDASAATATATPNATTPVTATTTPTPSPTQTPAPDPDAGLEIVTLLPPDAIPAIDDPAIVPAAAADEQLRANDLVIGVSIGGEHRAYGAAFLSGHEIVNDMLGGRAIAVTW